MARRALPRLTEDLPGLQEGGSREPFRALDASPDLVDEVAENHRHHGDLETDGDQHDGEEGVLAHARIVERSDDPVNVYEIRHHLIS